MNEKLEIQDLINESEDRKLEILIRLKQLNKKAYLFMRQFGKTWKQKYHEMWKQDFWKEGKQLLKEYYSIGLNGNIQPVWCMVCGKPLGDNFTLHHLTDFYNDLNYFTPLYIDLVHHSCHKKLHSKDHRNILTD